MSYVACVGIGFNSFEQFYATKHIDSDWPQNFILNLVFSNGKAVFK